MGIKVSGKFGRKVWGRDITVAVERQAARAPENRKQIKPSPPEQARLWVLAHTDLGREVYPAIQPRPRRGPLRPPVAGATWAGAGKHAELRWQK